MAYDEIGVKKKLYERMDEFFYFAEGCWRLNLEKLANIVSNIEDEAYEKGYSDAEYNAVMWANEVYGD